MQAFRIAAALACGVAGYFLTTQGVVPAVTWAMSGPAPKVVRTPAAQIAPLPKDLDGLLRLSRRLAPAQIATMRRRIERNPGDARTRALVMEATWYDRGDAEIKQAHLEQAAWFVANVPDSPILAKGNVNVDEHLDARTFALLAELYEDALAKRPRNPDVMANYAQLLRFSDKDRAIALLSRAAELDPKNPDRYERLAHLYSLKARGLDGARDRETSRLAFENYLKARSLGGDSSPKFLIESALDAGRADWVEREAGAVLRADPDAKADPDAVHGAHTALGRVALRRGDLAGARDHLLDSAKVPGSPVLGSFGPDTDLARELLEKGDRTTVLAYLEACGRFWKDERQARWIGEIRAGKTPDWDF